MLVHQLDPFLARYRCKLLYVFSIKPFRATTYDGHEKIKQALSWKIQAVETCSKIPKGNYSLQARAKYTKCRPHILKTLL